MSKKVVEKKIAPGTAQKKPARLAAALIDRAHAAGIPRPDLVAKTSGMAGLLKIIKERDKGKTE